MVSSLGLTELPRLSLPVTGSRSDGWWLAERLHFLLSASVCRKVLDQLYF